MTNLQPGVPVLCWCERCRKSFEWTPKQASDTPPRYHSKSCQDRNRKWIRDQKGLSCPTPKKHGYDSFEGATEVLLRVQNKDLTVYHCRCGKFHLGKGSYVVLKEDK